MICPKCGSKNVTVNAVTETKTKTRWGLGCLVSWLAFLVPKVKSKTHTEAVCQDCGYRWKVTGSQIRSNAAGTANSVAIDTEPFYKKKWFHIVCSVIFPPAGIALIWLYYKDMPNKKKWIFTAILAVWFIVALCFGGGDDTKVEDPVLPATSISDVVTGSDSEKISVKIIGGELGEYGKWVSLNLADAEPLTYIAYCLPAGDYVAHNLDPDYPLCICVYSFETEELDGNEYPADGSEQHIIEADGTDTFTIKEGYYIKLIGSEYCTSAQIDQM